MAYTYREAIKTAYKYLGIEEDKVTVLEETNNRGIVYNFDGVDSVIFIYPISCKQNNRQNFFDTRDSGAKERAVAWKYALKNKLRYFCLGFNEEQERYKDYVLSLESDENAISNVSFRKSDSSENTGTQVNIPNDFIPSENFERIKTPKGFFISAIKADHIREYIKLFDNRPYMAVDIEDMVEEDAEERNKRLFRYWMEVQVKPENDSEAGQVYSKDSIDQYVSNISTTPLERIPDRSVFYTVDIGEVQDIITVLDNSEKKNNTQRSAVKKYLEYLFDSQKDVDVEEIYNHNLYGIHMKNMNTALSPENPHICLGWSELGDLSNIDTKEQLTQLYEATYEKNANARGQDVGQLWRFIHDMEIGDYVIFAEYSVFHIGKVISDYYYDNTAYEGQEPDYVNTRKVIWLKKNISREILSKAMHNSLKTAMSFWTMNDYKAVVVDILKATYKKDENEEIGVEFMELVYNTSVSSPFERNRIIFGAPGTGKSYGLKEDSKKLVGDSEEQFERVTFHPDYSYSQFVGSYKPVTDEHGDIRYDFVPGPFMRIYVEALKSGRTENPKPYLLIIEEINRAKVASVFGDIFQLLDRDEDGVSEYDVQISEDVKKYLASKLDGKPENFKKIKIPNNLFIWATMNSADQGVFPMDTAFKRRWNFEYLGINDGEEKMSDGTITLGNDSYAKEITWNKLRKAINEVLAVDYKVNEDKLMGPFFLAKSVTESDENGYMKNPEGFIKAFKSKVIMYLYEDAAKQYKHKLFSGCENSKYSSVCEGFDKVGIEIFGDGFLERYSQQKG